MISYLIYLLIILINIYLYKSKYSLDDSLPYNLLYLYLIIVVHSINKVYALLISLSYVILKTNNYKKLHLESFEEENIEFTEYNDEENYETNNKVTLEEDYNDEENYEAEEAEEAAEAEEEEAEAEEAEAEEAAEAEETAETEYEDTEYDETDNVEDTNNTFTDKMPNTCNSNNMSVCLKNNSIQFCLNKYCNNQNTVNTDDEGNF